MINLKNEMPTARASNIIQQTMWKIWMQSLQGMAISINWVLTPTKRTKKTKSVLMDQVQSTIWTLIYSMCDNVGDMILKATA
jgi:hypothetical protein